MADLNSYIIVSANTITSNGNVTASNFVGKLANGNSNVAITTANGNITFAAVGNTTMTITGTGANITGTANVTGNITSGALSVTGNANVGNIGAGIGVFTGNVTANNFSGNITITGNVTGTSSNVTLVAGSYSTVVDTTGNVTAPATGYLMGGTLRSTNSTGNEGGELQLALSPNATLSGTTVSMDSYQNRVRIFEGGGNSRGVYIDLSKAPDGVGGELMWRASGVVNAGVDVTLGNLKARIPTSGNRSLQVSTVSGTYSVSGSEVYYAAGVGGGYIDGSTPLSITTTPTYLKASNNFNSAGFVDTWNIYDAGNSIGWRITCIIGVSYANNMISIERIL